LADRARGRCPIAGRSSPWMDRGLRTSSTRLPLPSPVRGCWPTPD